MNTYTGVIQLVWKFELDGSPIDAKKVADELLARTLEALPEGLKCSFHNTEAKIRVHSTTKGTCKLRLAEYPLSELFPLIPFDSPDYVSRRGYSLHGQVYSVKMNSLRYRVFDRDHHCCVVCGLRGDKLCLESYASSPRNAHFNLYGLEHGREILFTKDHIKPASKGGKEVLENLQTMCQVCNYLKGNQNVNMDLLRAVRLGLSSQEMKPCTNKLMKKYKQNCQELMLLENVNVYEMPNHLMTAFVNGSLRHISSRWKHHAFLKAGSVFPVGKKHTSKLISLILPDNNSALFHPRLLSVPPREGNNTA